MTEAGTATPSAPEATGSVQTPKQTAANIVKGIQEKANPVKNEVPESKTPDAKEIKDPAEADREKFIVNGKEVWLSKEQARAYVQKGLAFEPKVSELNRLLKETQAFLTTLKEDPARILFSDKLGVSPHQILQKIMASTSVSDETKEIVGQWYYDNVVAPANMSPQERELAEHRKWKAEREMMDKKQAEETAARENQFRVQQAFGEIKMKIGEALKEFNLPSLDTPIGAQIAKRVADIMRISHFKREPITAKEAANKVRAEMKQYHAMFLDSLDEENLVKELGEKNAEKVKKYFLKLVKQEDKTQKTNVRQPSAKAGERKTMSPDEFRDYLDDLKKKG